MNRKTITFPYAQVFCGKTFNYIMEAVIEEQECGSWKFISCVGGCNKLSNKLDLTDIIKDDEVLTEHVFKCISHNWQSDYNSVDELARKRISNQQKLRPDTDPSIA